MDTGKERSSTEVYRFRFGDAEFDEESMELRVAGLLVEIERKPLRVLAVLLRRHDEVVSREALSLQAWAGRPTVRHALSNAVLKLRKALRDERGQRIVTMGRSGYRLLGPVERVSLGQRLVDLPELAVGRPVPGKPAFELSQRLSLSSASEVWLAQDAATREKRVFKFSRDDGQLVSLKREVSLCRLLRETLGERRDFLRILDWNFAAAPFYLECEYAGENLLAWAERDQHLARLQLDERLALLLQAADAVAAAHGVGVLHKDLKPSNILVAASPDGWQLRVADFGSARLLEPERLKALGLTRLGLTVPVASDPVSGTPLYLAPELIVGAPSTVQSDVYALGLILYQLVVADLRRPMAPGWEKDISDELLREDIAAATDGQPARRLASVSELTARLRSLEARRGRRRLNRETEQRALLAVEHLKRARARRPWLAALVACLAAGLAISLWFYHGKSQALRQAQRETARAEAVVRFLDDDLLGAADPSGPGGTREATINQVLQRASARLATRFGDDPTTKASVELALGRAYFGVSEYAAAETHLRQAVALLRNTLPGDDPVRLDAEYALATDLLSANRIQDVATLLDETDRDAGPRLNEASLVAFRAHWVRAHLYKFQYKPDKALGEFEIADRIRTAVDPANDYLLFRIKDGLSWCYLRIDGRHEDAERVLRDLVDERYSPDLVGPLYWAQLRLDYGAALDSLSRGDEAETVIVAALNEIRGALGEDHFFVALAYNQLGDVYVNHKKLEAALAPYQKSFEIFRLRVGEHAQQTLVARTNLGILEYRNRRYDEAAGALSAVHEEFVKAYGEANPLSQITAFYLASTLIEGKITGSADAASLVSSLDAAALAGAEPGNDWPRKLQSLKEAISKRPTV